MRRQEIYLRDLVFIGKISGTYHGYLPKDHPMLEWAKAHTKSLFDVAQQCPDGLRVLVLNNIDVGACYKFIRARHQWVRLPFQCAGMLDLVSFPVTRANHD